MCFLEIHFRYSSYCFTVFFINSKCQKNISSHLNFFITSQITQRCRVQFDFNCHRNHVLGIRFHIPCLVAPNSGFRFVYNATLLHMGRDCLKVQVFNFKFFLYIWYNSWNIKWKFRISLFLYNVWVILLTMIQIMKYTLGNGNYCCL